MPIKYACFLSYASGQGELLTGFVTQLKRALENYIEPWLIQRVYIDQDGIQPGMQFDEALAQAICESVCMVVVYSPRYEQRPYCLREYAAMEDLEQRRLAVIGKPELRGRGMIIPVVFRGYAYLPPKIKNRIHVLNFEDYLTPGTSLTAERYAKEINEVAAYIFELYQAMTQAAGDPCDCATFALPAEDQVKPWREVRAPQLPR